ncbi:CKLF-like MARVEL transmembrane domain-containing protein 7 isoform X4 [Tamandua tetradactyla]|uniref:CKLF-like MARVEL transmembrane domain-containing protein 7 isoform X4 n=1 Tax=Tamandua tetradactyla TaxID=48850 RepID=UPI0040545028
MSHGAGVVRTTCSSGGGGAFGPGVGAAQPSGGSSEGLLDPIYPRTHAAQLKVAQMVTLLIAFICVKSSLWIDYSAYSYFEVVTICDLIMILAFYLVHLFRLYRVLTCINWPLSMQLSEDTSLQALTGASAGSRQDLQASDPGREASGSAFLCQSPAWLLANRRGPAAFLLPKKPLPWAP